VLGAGAITQHPLIAFLAHCRRAGRVADRNPFHPGTCPVTLWEADKPRSLRSSRRPCIRPFRQHPNRRQAKSSESLPCLPRDKVACLQAFGCLSGDTAMKAKDALLACSRCRRWPMVATERKSFWSPHPLPLYLCRLRLSPDDRRTVSPMKNRPRHQKAAAG
jgi:hypothetical protein